MNWQAVIDCMREDSRRLQDDILKQRKSDIATNATLGATALTLHYLADALQMGLNKRSETDANPPGK